MLKSIQPSDLPAPPEATARIVRACSVSDVGAHQLARVVARDPVLTAEILRTVNSAFFGLSRPVKSAAQAVTVLGNRALRNLALCLAVRDAVKPGAIHGFDIMDYWEDALRRAVAARCLSHNVGVDPDEAFTIGLLQDFGMLAILYAHPQKGFAWHELSSLLPNERLSRESEIFGVNHHEVGLMLAETWALPDALALPMAYHHTTDSEDIPTEHRLTCRLAACADEMASVFSAEDKEAALRECRIRIHVAFGLTADRVDQVLELIPQGVEEAAQSLGLRVQNQPALEDIMAEANRRLVKENLSYQELTWRLKKAVAENERLVEQLKEANRALEQIAYYDALTGLVNRRRFHEVFPAEIARHSRNSQPLSFVMLDLDHFKRINDSYGHPFGDTVLQSVASVLKEVLRATDIKVRVGGEELCIILPETDVKLAKQTTERVRAAIAGMKLQTSRSQVPVTASFGGCTWRGAVRSRDGIERVTKRLIDRADVALYEAKRSGRNRVVWYNF